MEKLCYLLFVEPERSGAELRTALIEKAAPALRAAGARNLVVHVHDEPVAAGSPEWKSHPPIRAMVSFWLENGDDRIPCEVALAPHARRLAGYLVVESRPLVHERPQGARTPGMNQVTCLSRRPGQSWEEFIHIWQGDHKIVAVETQSTVGYVRNTIVRPLTEGAPRWDAIVEETFPIEALTSPLAFYAAASQEDLERNLGRMMASCKRFIDFDTIEFTHMSEYFLG